MISPRSLGKVMSSHPRGLISPLQHHPQYLDTLFLHFSLLSILHLSLQLLNLCISTLSSSIRCSLCPSAGGERRGGERRQGAGSARAKLRVPSPIDPPGRGPLNRNAMPRGRGMGEHRPLKLTRVLSGHRDPRPSDTGLGEWRRTGRGRWGKRASGAGGLIPPAGQSRSECLAGGVGLVVTNPPTSSAPGSPGGPVLWIGAGGGQRRGGSHHIL